MSKRRTFMMNTTVQIWVLLLGLCFLKQHTFCWNLNGSWEAALQDNLFVNRHIVRPANIDETVNIKLSFMPTYLKEISIAQQIFNIVSTLVITWQDDSLRWNPGDYDNATYIYLPASSVWMPHFGVLNSAVKPVLASQSKRVFVTNTGTVETTISDSFTTMCKMDAKNFPFDTQTCGIIVTGWGSTASYENYTGIGMSTELLLISNEWELLKTGLENDYVMSYGKVYSRVEFIFTFRRRPDFYVATMIVPLITLSFLGLLVFPLPPDSGEKVSFSITCFLSFFVLQASITPYLPPSFSSMPYIVAMSVFLMFFNGLFLIMTVFTIRVVSKKPIRKIPGWLEILLIRSNKMVNSNDSLDIVQTAPIQSINLEEKSNSGLRSPEIEERSTTISNRIQERPTCTSQIEDDLEEKWKNIADSVNMILFWSFALILIVIVLVITMSLTMS